jgi:hypothetical protein
MAIIKVWAVQNPIKSYATGGDPARFNEVNFREPSALRPSQSYVGELPFLDRVLSNARQQPKTIQVLIV